MSSPIVKKAKPKQSLAVKLLAVVFSLSAVGAVISYVIYQEWAWREHRRNPDPETPPNTPHVLPISEPVVSENPLASTPEGLSDVIYLPREPFEEKISHDILGQELDRQALWITAREEFGLRPKDGGIGDAKPEGLPADRIFHVSLKLTEARMVSLTSVFEQGEKGQRRRVWTGPYYGNPNYYSEESATKIAEVEQRTTGRYKDSLVACHFTAKANPQSEAPLPPGIAEQLDQLDDTVLFSALRTLHAEMKSKGESPALLGGLVRAYGLLGVLCEHHWTVTPYAFKCRSLLYAQRLVRKFPDQPQSLWHRAFASAMCGLHTFAIDDLKRAKDLAAKQSKAESSPLWVDAIDAFVHFDPDRLAKAQKTGNRPLTRLLTYLIHEEPDCESGTLLAGKELTNREPNCFRGYEALFRMPGVSKGHSTSQLALQSLEKNLSKRVRSIPQLPATAVELVNGSRIAPADEAKLYSALFEAGHAAKDKEEPSWSVLAASLQETRFISGCARLNFLTAAIGTSSRDEAMPLAIALKSHPLLQVILMFNQDRVRDGPAFRQMISNLFDAQLDYRAGWLLNWLHRVDDQQAKLWYGQTMSRTCSTYQDRVRHSFMLTSQNVIPGPLNLYITVSPHSAYSHAKYVTNPKSTLPRTSAYGLTVAGADLSELPKIETRFSWSAVVQRSLAERYITEGKKVDSERCLSRLANLSADARTYRNLADMYLKQKKFDQWEESLLKSLEWGDLGLEHSRARVDLAEYYLKKKDVAKAATYAEEAASSGASWALLCLAECRAEQGQFDEADKLYEANDARYGAPFSWYFACRKYGKMDSKRAEARCEQVIGRLGEEMPNSLQLPLARYYLLKNELAKSRRLFLSNNVNNPAHVNRLFAGLVALAEGNAEEASSILFAASNTGADYLVGLAGTIRKWASDKTIPDQKTIDMLRKSMTDEDRPDADFFIGWYLSLLGETDRAMESWKSCNEAENGTTWIKAHASANRLEIQKQGKK